jgi:methylase of polypeptide subunit release factors
MRTGALLAQAGARCTVVLAGMSADEAAMVRADALVELLAWLTARGYRFHAVTPATHARVLARPAGPTDLRAVFGWNRAFAEQDVEPELLVLMRAAGVLREGRCALRVASLGDDLFLHSPYPTENADAVFFGPDTYRFVRFVQQHWPRGARQLVDLGAGSGAGAIAAARLAPEARVTLVDVNPQALALAGVNARAAGVAVELVEGREAPPGADVIVANPPYMMDSAARAYRDGGALLGGAVALQWVEQALDALAPGGTMLLYTGAAIVDGASPLVTAIGAACAQAGALLQVEEIDPDVFGEELNQPAYAQVERIAALGAVIRQR